MVALATTSVVAVSTVRSYTPSPLQRSDAEVAADALPRLEFLRAELEGGAGEEMQRISRVNVGTLQPDQRDRALREARWTVERLEAPAGTAPFPADADPSYGVFHAGWTAWLGGRIVEWAGGPQVAGQESGQLRSDAAALRDAFDAALDSGTPYLEAYHGQAWPMDSVVAVAVLRLDDRVHGTGGHDASVQRLSGAVQNRLDPQAGLIPHSVNPATGEPREGARGSWQSLLLRFLAEVDLVWATRDYHTFRAEFGSEFAMVPGVREYPQGDDSSGDIDSGPLVLGLSASASAVALGDAVLFADERGATALTGLAEATGMAVQYDGNRRYLGGLLPVGDAFVAWSLTAGGEHAATAPDEKADPEAAWWRVPWHLCTAAVLALLWFAAVRAWRAARRGTVRCGGSVRNRSNGSIKYECD